MFSLERGGRPTPGKLGWQLTSWRRGGGVLGGGDDQEVIKLVDDAMKTVVVSQDPA